MRNNFFGENLKRIRHEKGITQKQLADMIMISTPNISRWENGESYPQIIWIYIIANALSISPESLIMLPNTKVDKTIR